MCPFSKKCWSDEKTDCWQSRVIYQLSCIICGAIYTGTTACSIHKRTLQHQEGLKRGDTSNPMAKHFKINHPERDTSIDQLFKATIIDTRLSNLERYISEGICIEDSILDNKAPQLNSKGEWGRIQTKRLVVANN